MNNDLNKDPVPQTGTTALALLDPLLLRRIADRLDWTTLRPAQLQAIAPILFGANTLVLAPTAGGKTEAAFLPILSLLKAEAHLPLAVLYLSPLKALLNNQEPRLQRLAGLIERGVFRWHGEVAESAKAAFLREPSAMLLITPESLEGLLLARRGQLFARLRFVVVDEAHAFAGTERGVQLLSLIERIAAFSCHDVQRIGLSATIGQPAELLDWLSGSSQRARQVVDPPRAGNQRYFTLKYLPDATSEQIARMAVPFLRERKSIFFVESRRTAEALLTALATQDMAAQLHHASLSGQLRETAENTVQAQEHACLIATSTMELGVDIGDLDVVLQLGAPHSVASYLQRMGRSGRRGSPGRMVVLANDRSSFLRALALTELALRRWVEPARLSQRAWGVYVQQILALLLASDRPAAKEIYRTLHGCPAFSAIRPTEFAHLLEHLCRQNLLERVRHRLQMGYAAEREFGARHYAALCSTIANPAAQLTVYFQGQPIGTLDRSFAKRLARGGKFQLAGQIWQPKQVGARGVSVHAANDPEGSLPYWRGGWQEPMHSMVATEIRQLLVTDNMPNYLASPEAEQLIVLREQARAAGLATEIVPLQGHDGQLRFWTLAGERINRVIGCLLAAALGCRYRQSWEQLVISTPDRSGQIDKAKAIALWAHWSENGLSAADYAVVSGNLPDIPGARFLRYLPPEFAAEEKMNRFVDFEETVAFLTNHQLRHTVQPSSEIARAYADASRH